MKRTNMVLTTISSLALVAAGSLSAIAADDRSPVEAQVGLDTDTRQAVLQAGSLSQAQRNLEVSPTGYTLEAIIAAGSLSAVIQRQQDAAPGAERVDFTGVPLETIMRAGSLSQVLRNTESVAQPVNLAAVTDR